MLVHNSTPLFSQLSLEDLGENLGSLSPVVSDFNVSSIAHNPRRFPENDLSKHGNSNHDNSSNHGNHSNPSYHMRRGKRKRCRVQSVVHIPLTQNESLHEDIRPPDTSVKETHLLETETSSDSDVILELMKSDDFSLSEHKENVPVISNCIDVQKDEFSLFEKTENMLTVSDYKAVQRDDFSLFEEKENMLTVSNCIDVQKDELNLFEETEDMLTVSNCKERNMSCNLTNSQDFDSFDVGSISAALPILHSPTSIVTTSPLCSDDDLFANSPDTKEEPVILDTGPVLLDTCPVILDTGPVILDTGPVFSEHDWSDFSAMSECNTSTKSNGVPMVTGMLSDQDGDVSNCSVELF